MRLSGNKALAAIYALHGTISGVAALEATILADTNRDGKVDAAGDAEAKALWTSSRGALFLANIADTDRRCSDAITRSTPDEDLEKCHDASDDVLRNQRFLAPLRTLPIAELSTSATGKVQVVTNAAVDKVRIFVKTAGSNGGGWQFVAANHTFTASELRDGLELGIDARDVRRPQGWDGHATVRFTVNDGASSSSSSNATATDEVALRVAPVLTHHHAQLAQRVFTTEGGDLHEPPQAAFVSDLVEHTLDAGLENEQDGDDVVFRFNGDSDIWTQDFFEPGYSSIPGPDGEPIVLRVMIRSSQRRSAGRQIFTHLRDSEVGAVQYITRTGHTIDSHGNLETIPPHASALDDGVSYPAGRIIMGSFAADDEPVILDFFRAQETQDPLVLDTSWLVVGHVDEFLQFLPAHDNELGWRLAVADPIAGLALLQEASDAGHGAEPAYSRPARESDNGYCVPQTTVDDELARPDMRRYNDVAAERIQANVDLLKRETGLTDDDIIRLPSVFYEWDWDLPSCTAAAADSVNTLTTSTSSEKPAPLGVLEAGGGRGINSRIRARQQSANPLVAHYPGVVNGVVLSGSYVVAPNPWGPVIDGQDILAAPVVEAYAKANYNVTFMDDYFSHHILDGEIHCGSNTWRDATAPWW